MRDRELETQSISDKLNTDSERLYSGRIKSPKELGDLQKETEYLKRRKASLEDRQLEAMMALEEATTRLAVANEEYVVVEAAWKADNSELSEEYDTLKQELTQLSGQRKRVAPHITEKDMSEYTRFAPPAQRNRRRRRQRRHLPGLPRLRPRARPGARRTNRRPAALLWMRPHPLCARIELHRGTRRITE